MKTILLLPGLMIKSVSVAQDLNDTLYYKSGAERPVQMVKETESSLSYKYEKENGWIVSGRTRKSMLRGYAIYDENNNLVASELKPLKKKTRDEVVQEEKSSSFLGGFLTGTIAGVITTTVVIFSVF